MLRGILLLILAADKPFFFVGQPLEVQKTSHTLPPEAPSGQAQRVLNMVSHVAGCSTLVHHEGQHLWQPTADEHIARNHLKEAYLQSVDIFMSCSAWQCCSWCCVWLKACSCLGGLMV